jgi:nucleoside phosphorylase
VKAYFDAIIIVPLEEEFENVLTNFNFVEDLSSDRQIMFSVSIPDRPLEILLAKQSKPGRTGTQETTLNCLDTFDAGVLICIGIAGGLSSDVMIGDVCYTGSIIDVLDNAKASETPDASHNLALSPTTYSSPREISIAITLDRLSPNTKGDHEAWTSKREKDAQLVIPGEFSGKNGKKERIVKPSAREGSIVCGFVSASPEYNRKLMAIDRKILAIETESGALFSIAHLR